MEKITSIEQINFSRLLKVCIRAARRAAAEILEIYNRPFSVAYKSDHSPVTEADKRADAVISEILRQEYPSFFILSEESYEAAAESETALRRRMENPFCFIVDPLDGTKEFVKRNNEFTVNIALSYCGRAVAGVVYIPVSGTLYYAAKDFGAYKCTAAPLSAVSFSEENRKPVIASAKTDCAEPELFCPRDQIRVSERSGHVVCVTTSAVVDEQTTQLLNRCKEYILDVVKTASAIKVCCIAEGRADVYVKYGYTMEWDTAAEQIIVEEAGGIFRQLDEARSEMTYNRKDCCNRKGFYVLNRPENMLLDF